MTLKITGKNLDIGDNLRVYAVDKVTAAFEKYAGRLISGQLSVEKSHERFTTHCAIHLASGLDMQASGEGADAYASVDAAIERLEKRLRRYKRRLKQHTQKPQQFAYDDNSSGIDYTLKADSSEDQKEPEGFAPAVIAETPARVGSMSVSDAVMQMDLADRTFIVFLNAAHGGVNVVYRRDDGNIGWIDPNATQLSKR